MSFGFSVGDILACIEVATKTYSALKNGPTDFKDLALELASLTNVLEVLKEEVASPTSSVHHTTSLRRQAQIGTLLENCSESMQSLRELVTKYPRMGKDEKRSVSQWLKFVKENKQSPRDKLAIHTASINMFLTSLTHGALGRVEFLLKNPKQGTSLPLPSATTGSYSTSRGPQGSNASASSNNSHASGTWNKISQDLATEGIYDQQMDKFQEDIKAYVRYLVNGETPFWTGASIDQLGRKNAFSKKEQAILQEAVMKGRKEQRQKLSSGPHVISVDSPSPERSRKDGAEAFIARLEQLFEPEAGTRPSSNIDVEDDDEPDRDNQEIIILPVSDIPSPPSPSLLPYPPPPPPISRDPKSYRGIHDHPFRPPSYPHDSPNAYPHPFPHASEPNKGHSNNLHPPDVPMRTKDRSPSPSQSTDLPSVHRTRKRLTRYLDELDARKSLSLSSDRKHYLSSEAIPRCLTELQAHMQVSPHPPRKWCICDVCELVIPGQRHRCRSCKGEFDVCEECWQDGKGCGIREHGYEEIRI
ncbi:hypothetical protein C1H76_7319 [Elsinoe australis]|uniref:Fungal N-terminal domain-containing protein n=1 Tax=Elsinoe australis TaxID=40998 RepID=A0A4U7ARF0_9PEZI|nr:hypothetical protein C1H76_7319 [Elsinoe australis]